MSRVHVQWSRCSSAWQARAAPEQRLSEIFGRGASLRQGGGRGPFAHIALSLTIRQGRSIQCITLHTKQSDGMCLLVPPCAPARKCGTC